MTKPTVFAGSASEERVDASLKFQRNKRNMPSWSRQRKNGENGEAGGKGCIFCHAAEMKRPHPIKGPLLKAVFKFVVDTRFQLERKSSLEIIWRSRNNSSKLDFM